jgi:hypothetical protein
MRRIREEDDEFSIGKNWRKDEERETRIVNKCGYQKYEKRGGRGVM